jgi:hypothetical protein
MGGERVSKLVRCARLSVNRCEQAWSSEQGDAATCLRRSHEVEVSRFGY